MERINKDYKRRIRKKSLHYAQIGTSFNLEALFRIISSVAERTLLLALACVGVSLFTVALILGMG